MRRLVLVLFCFSSICAKDKLTEELDESVKKQIALQEEQNKLFVIQNQLKEIEQKVNDQLSLFQEMLLQEQQSAFIKQNKQIAEAKNEIEYLNEELIVREERRKRLLEELQHPGVDPEETLAALHENQKEIEKIVLEQGYLLDRHNQLLAEQYAARERIDLDKQKSCPTRDSGFGLFGQYLYWRVRQNGLDIAGKGSLTPGDIQDIEFGMQSGFRVGAKYIIDDLWSISASYLYFSPDGSQKVSNGDQTIFYTRLTEFTAQSFQISPLQSTTASDILREADSTITISLYLYDVNFLRTVLDNSSFCLGFEFGLQGTYAKEELDIFYRGDTQLSIAELGEPLVETSFDFFLTTTDIWKFSGAGPYVGTRGYIPLYKELNFSILTTATLLIGHYTLRSFSSIIQGSTGVSSITSIEQLYREYRTFDSTEKYVGMNYLFLLRGGLSWFHPYSNGSLFFLELMYEGFLWIDLARFKKGVQGSAAIAETPSLQAVASSSSISFIDQNHLGVHGLVASMGVKF